MRKYIIKRLGIAVITLFLITIAVFAIIQLPPGNFVDVMVSNMTAQGEVVTNNQIQELRNMYGVNRPFIVQYLAWITGIFKGNFGTSLYYNQPVISIIGETLGNTLILSFFTLIFTYIVSVPIAIFSAKHQNSILDYFFNIVGFLGMAIPNFLLAIILMYISQRITGKPLMGLIPKGGITSWKTFIEFLKNLIIPVVVIGASETCGLIRILRAQLLDEQQKPYILALRAKGVSEFVLTYKYMLRAIINPIVSNLAGILKELFNGSTITAIVLMLPVQGPVLLKALQTKDTYLSGAILLITAVIIVLGNVLSDVLLSILDPRIKYEEEAN